MKDGKRCSGSIPYGYNRLPNDKQTLVVDPVASEVVKRIFLLANDGKSTRAIAEILTEEKALTPAAYAKEYHPEQYNGNKFTNPYLWAMSTIRNILDRQEYLGHTVLRKSVSTNYGRMRERYLKEHKRVLYYTLLTSGKLYEHLAEIDTSACDMAEYLIKEMARKQGVTEQLKAVDMMRWIGLMHNIRACVNEIVF